jgi:hypothetical protein
VETLIASLLTFAFVTIVSVDGVRKRREYLQKQTRR